MRIQDIDVCGIDPIGLEGREIRDYLGRIYNTQFRIIALMSIMDRKQKIRKDMDLEKIGLTVVQAQILFYIMVKSKTEEECEITAKELEGRFRVSNPTMSGILKRLEKKGFIERRPGVLDRRKQQIRLKGECDSLCRIAEKRMEEENRRLFRGFTDEELDRLSELLTKLLYNMENGNEE